MESVISTRDLNCGYGKLVIVPGVSLEVRAGEVVCLLGPNGAGKTTTLLTLAGVLPSLGGELTVLGEAITHSNRERISRFGLSLVTEGRGLFYRLTVAENLRLRHHRQSTVSVAEIVDAFPILRDLMNRKAGLLSGGEQQVVAIAGSLVSDPKAIMLDEMSLGLAPVIVESLLPTVRGIARDRGIGVLLVEQHIGVALEVADRGYVMSRGQVRVQGSNDELRALASEMEATYLGRA